MNFSGEMVNTIQVNGKMEKNMEVAIGNQAKETAIWANGKMGKLLVMEFIQLMLDRDMKGNF